MKDRHLLQRFRPVCLASCIAAAAFTFFLATASSCSNSSLGKLVGGDRDEHGCLSSAGYTWSYALHDCVRLWEVGQRMEGGPKSVFLIFSKDSLFAEVFVEDGFTVLCKRQKNTNIWTPSKGTEKVAIANGVTTVSVQNYDYTK